MKGLTIEEGLKLHAAGEFKEAESIYRQILKQEPSHPGALHLLGVAASQQNRKEEAVELIGRAIALSPRVPEFHSNLALVFLEQGLPEKALAACRKALELDSRCADAHNHAGAALRQLGRPKEAEAALSRALAINPDHADALANRGAVLAQLGRHAEAAESYQRLQRIRPGGVTAICHLADALREQGRMAEAETAYQRAIEQDPSFAPAHNGLGVLYQQTNRLDEAIASYEKALALNDRFAPAHNNLGFALACRGMVDQAIERYRRAIALRPDEPDTYNNLGNAHLSRLELDESMAAYDRALYFRPDHSDAHWNKALLQLLLGDFQQGWREYEWRWLKFPHERRGFASPQWDGSDIAGKTILLHAEQGFGDTLQFVRYAPLVAEQGAVVLLECQPAMQSLLRSVRGVSKTFAKGDSLQAFDLHCPLLSLPYALGTRLDNIPGKVPYLWADANLAKAWERKLANHAGKYKVGLAWAGARIHRKDWERSIAPKILAPLGELQDVAFFSLQKGENADELAERLPLFDFTTDLHDFADTAALIHNLDLVIAVDTAVVHLAGAMGKPVWTLLPFSPDWRWMLNRSDSPWYPTMRLFRQSKRNDWGEVIEQVCTALRQR